MAAKPKTNRKAKRKRWKGVVTRTHAHTACTHRRRVGWGAYVTCVQCHRGGKKAAWSPAPQGFPKRAADRRNEEPARALWTRGGVYATGTASHHHHARSVRGRGVAARLAGGGGLVQYLNCARVRSIDRPADRPAGRARGARSSCVCVCVRAPAACLHERRPDRPHTTPRG
jgi:hypothetical protein